MRADKDGLHVVADEYWGTLPTGGLRNLMGLMEDIKAKDDAIEALLASLDADALNPEQFNAYCRLEALIKPSPHKD